MTAATPRRPPVATLFAAASLCGAALGYVVCILGGLLPSLAAAWACMAAAGLGTGLLASLLSRPAPPPQPDPAQQAELDSLRRQAAERQESQRRIRHDLRGALSPLMLVTDRLTAHADPAVQRTGAIMLRSVERATALLDEEAVANPRDQS